MPIDLAAYPRVILGQWPTPLDDCPRLTEALGGPRILVKRDDVNGLGVGGNKLRKLEFLIGEALAAGVDTVITFGALQTNHGRQTAAVCARLGLRCELILVKEVDRADEAYEKSGNMLLDHLYGAHVHICETGEEAGQVYERVNAERNAVTFPVGGSNSTGILGYVAAAAELHDQRADIDKIVVAVGSAGTAAGLALGIKQLDWPVTLIGACVSRTAEESRAYVEGLAGAVDIELTDRAVGAGYGVPTRQMWAAVRLFARTEGITLDPVYSGKAAAALVDMIRNGEIRDDETVVFVHTGGLPGLFAYAPDLIASV
ncbi:D-cysteine desulfhydrase family protein [Actinocrispum wychmicini]|uniref:D-cysteine desulfhydrase n=1 Tax=Actinocrispum wychmicini TaxID=1213861 RepID=A0A4R2IHI3_9PSEU|nr:D-cysteine desulfhydrase family protein [Actinocrispum wychmicini]TCO44233.1 D-cysteine desulfhydrase [Actinocrispum wychmicini]